MSGGANPMEAEQCRICAGALTPLFSQRIMRKYEVSYRRCGHCGLVQTERPYWLDEAYASPIAECDTGVVARNLALANISTCLLRRLGHGASPCLDAAGGYGLFTRLMRDIGFDYYWWDPHASNLLARGFEGDPAARRYGVVSAFEVLEHLTDPIRWLRELKSRTGCDTIIASTELYRGDAPARDWWYYAFDTGQHISFYQRQTLEFLAQELGLQLHSHRNIHLWTSRPLASAVFRQLARPGVAAVFARLARLGMRSRVWSDSQQLSGGAA